MTNRFVTKCEASAISMKTMSIQVIGAGVYGTIIKTIPEKQQVIVEFDIFGSERWQLSMSVIRQM